MRLLDALLDLSDRQLARLSAIRIDNRNRTVTLSIHIYDGMETPLAEDIDGVQSVRLSRVPDVVVSGVSACDSVDAAYEQLAELPAGWVGNLNIAKFVDDSGWRVLAKTHAGSDAERFAWLRAAKETTR